MGIGKKPYTNLTANTEPLKFLLNTEDTEPSSKKPSAFSNTLYSEIYGLNVRSELTNIGQNDEDVQ